MKLKYWHLHAFYLRLKADVIHPAAHTEGRPSFTALVANVDSDTAKYIADCRVQTSRQEMIDDLKEMAIVCVIHRDWLTIDSRTIHYHKLSVWSRSSCLIEGRRRVSRTASLNVLFSIEVNIVPPATFICVVNLLPLDGVSEGQFKQVLEYGELTFSYVVL